MAMLKTAPYADAAPGNAADTRRDESRQVYVAKPRHDIDMDALRKSVMKRTAKASEYLAKK